MVILEKYTKLWKEITFVKINLPRSPLSVLLISWSANEIDWCSHKKKKYHCPLKIYANILSEETKKKVFAGKGKMRKQFKEVKINIIFWAFVRESEEFKLIQSNTKTSIELCRIKCSSTSLLFIGNVITYTYQSVIFFLFKFTKNFNKPFSGKYVVNATGLIVFAVNTITILWQCFSDLLKVFDVLWRLKVKNSWKKCRKCFIYFFTKLDYIVSKLRTCFETNWNFTLAYFCYYYCLALIHCSVAN